MVCIAASHNAGSEAGSIDIKSKESFSAGGTVFSRWDMLCLASGECAQNKENEVNAYFKKTIIRTVRKRPPFGQWR